MIPGPIAIFDLDRTMHAGSGLGVFARHAFRAKFIGADRMVKSFVHDLVFRRGASTDGHISTIAAFALEMAGGKTLDELQPIVAATTSEIVESVRVPMRAVLELHREAGHCCVLLSASPQQLVGPIADALGFDYGIGTLIEEADGVLTGKIVPPMCYGEEKLTRLRAEIGWPPADIHPNPRPHQRSDQHSYPRPGPRLDQRADHRTAPVAVGSTVRRSGAPHAESLPSGPEPAATAPATLAARPGSTGATTYAYADSMSDLPLLEAVQLPFVVAPDRKLRELAQNREWPILDLVDSQT